MSYAIDRPEEPVNPAHYRLGKVELIDLVEVLSFNIGNAVKYLVRAGKKGDLAEDLKKAIWYAERELVRLTGKPSEAQALQEKVALLERALVTDEEKERLHAELADYERTVESLREQLRESERGRSASNATDAAARRMMATAVDEGHPTDVGRVLLNVDESCLRRLAMAIADAGKVPA